MAAGGHNRESSKERCNMTDALREKLVQAGRVLVSEDQGDYVAGHCVCLTATGAF
jgi:hypothetical protein